MSKTRPNKDTRCGNCVNFIPLNKKTPKAKQPYGICPFLGKRGADDVIYNCTVLEDSWCLTRFKLLPPVPKGDTHWKDWDGTSRTAEIAGLVIPDKVRRRRKYREVVKQWLKRMGAK